MRRRQSASASTPGRGYPHPYNARVPRQTVIEPRPAGAASEAAPAPNTQTAARIDAPPHAAADATPDAPGDTPPPAPREPVTLRTLRRMAERGEPFACLTASDATTARWLARAGVHLLLMPDSAAETILGFPRTIFMPLDLSIALTAAVKRGAPDVVVMGDMPFLSYQTSDEEGVRNAGRYLTEGHADIVKMELDASFAPLVEKLARAGIPVCAHVGLKPQHVLKAGGYVAAGRTAEDAARVVADAVALERAGAVMLLVEAVPDEVTKRIVEETTVPLIGIGAGTACHGQILVVQDLLGMTDHPPRFAEAAAALGPAIRTAGVEWVRRVAAGNIGGQRYSMPEPESERFGRAKG